MELTFTNLVMIMAGIIALTVVILLYSYFNGGTQTVLDMVLGMIRT